MAAPLDPATTLDRFEASYSILHEGTKDEDAVFIPDDDSVEYWARAHGKIITKVKNANINKVFGAIYVINSDTCPSRWKYISAFANASNVKLTRWRAYSPENMNWTTCPVKISPRSEDHNQKTTELMLGAVGLFSSHHTILHDIIEKGYKQALILEDDYWLSDYMLAKSDKIMDAIDEASEEYGREWHMINLARSVVGRVQYRELLPKMKLKKPITAFSEFSADEPVWTRIPFGEGRSITVTLSHPSWSAGTYILSQAGARLLANWTDEFWVQMDDQLRWLTQDRADELITLAIGPEHCCIGSKTVFWIHEKLFEGCSSGTYNAGEPRNFPVQPFPSRSQPENP